MELEKLVLESKYPQYQFIVKGPRITVWKDGYPVQEPKHIVLFFDRFLCVMEDTIRDQELSEEDCDFVKRGIEAAFKNPTFTDMKIHEAPKINAPWPTYDTTHHNQVPVIASQIGMVAEAIAYETRGREGGPRESVVKKLAELQNGAPAPDHEDDLVAA